MGDQYVYAAGTRRPPRNGDRRHQAIASLGAIACVKSFRCCSPRVRMARRVRRRYRPAFNGVLAARDPRDAAIRCNRRGPQGSRGLPTDHLRQTRRPARAHLGAHVHIATEPVTFWVSSPSPNAAHAGRCGQCHRHRDDLCAAAGLFAGKLLDVIGRRGGGRSSSSPLRCRSARTLHRRRRSRCASSAASLQRPR